MQDISNAPWDGAANSGMNRDQYIEFLKNQEIAEEKGNEEP